MNAAKVPLGNCLNVSRSDSRKTAISENVRQSNQDWYILRGVSVKVLC